MVRFPPKRILVPMDLSELSYAGYRHAKALADRFGCQLRLLHVELPPPLEFAPKHWEASETRRRRGEITAEIRRHTSPGAALTLDEGDPAVVILRFVRTWKPDLVVMGAHGRAGLDRLLLGSVTETVMRRCPVPVLATRGEPSEIRSVLAPVNFTAHGDYAFAYAAAVAYSLGAKVKALHVEEPSHQEGDPRLFLNALVRRLPSKVVEACRAEMEVTDGDPPDEIAMAARRADLVVLATHRRGVLRDALLGTTAEKVLRNCPVPILAVPGPRARVGAALQHWKFSKT